MHFYKRFHAFVPIFSFHPVLPVFSVQMLVVGPFFVFHQITLQELVFGTFLLDLCIETYVDANYLMQTVHFGFNDRFRIM